MQALECITILLSYQPYRFIRKQGLFCKISTELRHLCATVNVVGAERVILKPLRQELEANWIVLVQKSF